MKNSFFQTAGCFTTPPVKTSLPGLWTINLTQSKLKHKNCSAKVHRVQYRAMPTCYAQLLLWSSMLSSLPTSGSFSVAIPGGFKLAGRCSSSDRYYLSRARSCAMCSQDKLFAHAPATLLSEVGREARDRPGGVACFHCSCDARIFPVQRPCQSSVKSQKLVSTSAYRDYHVRATLLLLHRYDKGVTAHSAVQGHVSNILRKFQPPSRSDITARYFRSLLSLP